ncbi:aminoacyl--tRNA ligase-related protein [Nonomuraea insulae]|uniref:Aminoacyl--tRNA ligase-related protein n=1 Tax=Nonomuraea insulae TaxID=1616787 RepID=A0ABW1CNT3_9ACTN
MLATLGPDLVRLRAALETRFTGWAAESGAAAMLYPPLVPVADLERIDYFRNFPHLALLGSGLNSETIAQYGDTGLAGSTVPATALTDPAYALPSAACYQVYFDLAGQQLDLPRQVTTVATCFRREDHYDGLRRLLGFSMREVVCVGDRDTVREHLSSYKEMLTGYLATLGLPVKVEPATDPFFESGGSGGARALMAQLFPVKEEFLYGGTLAIASVNFHRNFFGERCDIRTADGSPAFTGCVAFGIERWISALTTHFDQLSAAELCELVLAG